MGGMATMTAREATAREAWSLLMELAFANKARFIGAMADFDLTPVQGHVLRILGNQGPLAMSELAEALSCDASNVTGMVDRLEARALVERRPGARDRRVKEIVLTPAGVELRGHVLERMSEPPAAIASLSVRDQRVLRDVLARALER
jgi:MarR family transcriptional regulator, organic hydroperoxide resistance regulator